MDALFSFLPPSWLGLETGRGGCGRPVPDRAQPARRARIGAAAGAGVLPVSGHPRLGGALRVRHACRRAGRAARRHRQGRARRVGRDRRVRGDARCCCAPTAWARAPTPASRRSATACRSCASRGCGPAGARCCSWPSRWAAWSPGCWWPTCCSACTRSRARRSTPCCSNSSPPAGRRGSAARFVQVALTSAAALLLVAAQAGFLDGPRVLANMALDRWMPIAFHRAERPVRHAQRRADHGRRRAARAAAHARRGRTCWSCSTASTCSSPSACRSSAWCGTGGRCGGRSRAGGGRLPINAVGLGLTSFILVTLVVLKFDEGGWVTMLMTSALIAVAFAVRRHYDGVRRQLASLDGIVEAAELPPPAGSREFAPSSNRTRDRAGQRLQRPRPAHRAGRRCACSAAASGGWSSCRSAWSTRAISRGWTRSNGCAST